MADLQYRQINGDAETVSANVVSKVKIPAVEQHLVHVKLETPQFNSRTGKKESRPIIQTYYPIEFEEAVKTGAFKGMKVELIHQPEKSQLTSLVKGVNKENDAEAAKLAGEDSKEEEEDDLTESEIDDFSTTLDSLTKRDLQSRYAELYGEPAPEKTTKIELIEAIEAKISE